MDVTKVSLRFKRSAAILFGACVALGAAWVGVRAQSVAKEPVNGTATATTSDATGWKLPPRPAPECCGYPFPRETDAEIADGAAHIVHYEDSHIMLMEVANPPMFNIHMHGHPYASVFAHDSDTGAKNPDALRPTGPTQLDRTTPYNDMGSTNAPGPNGAAWPTCTPAAPQAPHRPYNANMAPNHFYRLEFLRLDGTDLAAHWKEWYPEMTAAEKPVKDLVPGPGQGPKFSAEWPYPIAYDSIQAAPNNYKLLYENDKVRLLEVTVRPGETTPMHGTPYSYVMAFNSTSLLSPDVTDKFMDPKSPLNGAGAGQAGAPKTQHLTEPTCTTMAPRAPHAIHNGGAAPLHYYQLEYKRIDGDGLTAHWKEWYPWMQYMQALRQPVP
jgi:hypothetical protein